MRLRRKDHLFNLRRLIISTVTIALLGLSSCSPVIATPQPITPTGLSTTATITDIQTIILFLDKNGNPIINSNGPTDTLFLDINGKPAKIQRNPPTNPCQADDEYLNGDPQNPPIGVSDERQNLCINMEELLANISDPQSKEEIMKFLSNKIIITNNNEIELVCGKGHAGCYIKGIGFIFLEEKINNTNTIAHELTHLIIDEIPDESKYLDSVSNVCYRDKNLIVSTIYSDKNGVTQIHHFHPEFFSTLIEGVYSENPAYLLDPNIPETLKQQFSQLSEILRSNPKNNILLKYIDALTTNKSPEINLEWIKDMFAVFSEKNISVENLASLDSQFQSFLPWQIYQGARFSSFSSVADNCK
jgi:hypothetical protein